MGLVKGAKRQKPGSNVYLMWKYGKASDQGKFCTSFADSPNFYIFSGANLILTFSELLWQSAFENFHERTHYCYMGPKITFLHLDKSPLCPLQAWRSHQLLLQPLWQTSAPGRGNFTGPAVWRWAGEQNHRQQCKRDTRTPAGVGEDKTFDITLSALITCLNLHNPVLVSSCHALM